VSLTEVEHVFAGVHENGINDLLQAFFTARPRYLNYGSSAFVASTTVAATNMSAIAFPGIPGGIQYAVSLAIPKLDFHPDSSGGASPLPVGLGQFVMNTRVRLTVGCAKWVSRPNKDNPLGGSITSISTSLEVWVRGGLIATYSAPGSGEIGFQVDEVELVDVKPDSLESVMECVIRMIIQAVLSTVQLPIDALTAKIAPLILTRGPEIEDDQVKLYGDL
jgi:hypothetical protein